MACVCEGRGYGVAHNRDPHARNVKREDQQAAPLTRFSSFVGGKAVALQRLDA
jgi:hypothetical protein